MAGYEAEAGIHRQNDRNQLFVSVAVRLRRQSRANCVHSADRIGCVDHRAGSDGNANAFRIGKANRDGSFGNIGADGYGDAGTDA